MESLMRLVLVLALVLSCGCGATFHPEFDRYAVQLQTVSIVHRGEQVTAAWGNDLEDLLAECSRLKVEAPLMPQRDSAFDPVGLGRELGAGAVLALIVDDVRFVPPPLGSVSAGSLVIGEEGDPSHLDGWARLYDVESGLLLWELSVDFEGAELPSAILRLCSEQIVDAWPPALSR
jgi:hypothetical protein